MKACVFTGIVFTIACSTMVSAAPAPAPAPESLLLPRGAAASKIAPAIERWALSPQSMADRDQKKKNRDNAIKMATGTGNRVSSGRHPEMQKAMDKYRYKAPSRSKSSKK